MIDYSGTSIEELAATIAKHLEDKGIRVVLVGGLAVEIYAENLYLTKDIDMVNTSYNPPPEIRQAMSEIEFHKRGRVYANETTDISVEFPSAPLSVGEQLIKETTTIDTAHGEIPILFAKDVIKDRLAAYFHWGDKPSLVQSLAIMANHHIPAGELKLFCTREGEAEQFELIKKLQKKVQKQKLSTMEQIEALVIAETIDSL